MRDANCSVLVVDDHHLVRRGLNSVLRGSLGISEVWEAGSIAEASRILAKGTIGLVLLDLSLPDADGLSGLEALHKDYPLVPIIVLTAHTQTEIILKAFSIGAKGFVSKSVTPSILVSAINVVLAGGRYLPEDVFEVLGLSGGIDRTESSVSPTQQAVGGEAGFTGSLTPRQIEVSHMLAQGASNKEICRSLGLAIGTVKKHVAAVMHQLGVDSRAKAISLLVHSEDRPVLSTQHGCDR